MKSKLTGGETKLLFESRVLNKYNVRYYLCQETGFIQTEEPYWLDEAYKSVITKLDVGIVHRNMRMAQFAETLLVKFFNYKAQFLDYAGGYGLFTRIMRDKGFDFHNVDPYCPNIFAEYFDLSTLPVRSSFEMVTAFEVFEHLANPLEEIVRIFSFSDNILFTTELRNVTIEEVRQWHYLSFETGQHVAFFTREALQYVAKHFGYFFYTDGISIHLFTKKPLTSNPFARKPREPFLLRKARKYVRKADACEEIILDSLIGHDWELIRKDLNGS